jgi:bacterioferritin-associated ferredoxin
MSYKSPLESKPDYLVCTCFGVMYSEISTAIKNGCKSFESLQESLMVGTGCSSCVQEVYEILKEEHSKIS